MKKNILSLVFIFALSGASSAQELPYYSRYYYSFGAGAAVPFGGHWGDGGVGFKAGPAFSLAAAKKVDEIVSYGVETAYSFGHRNRDVSAIDLRLFSLTPFLRAACQAAGRTYYGILGGGIYHWTQPSFNAGGADFDSDSGSSFGFNMGGGAILPLRGAWQLGLELRWHHIFSVKGDHFDVNLANNLSPSVLVFHGF
jgi:hypothetical protein